MEIVNAMVCTAAEVRGGLLYVLGGAPESWSAKVQEQEDGSVAFSLGFTLAGTIRRDGKADPVGFDLAFVPAELPRGQGVNGQWRAEGATSDRFVEGSPNYVNFVLGLNLTANRVGPWEVRLTPLDGGDPTVIPLGVRAAD